MKPFLKSAALLIIECCALYLLSVFFLLGGVASAMTSPLLGGSGVAADLPLWSILHLYDFAVLLVIWFLFSKPERREDGYYLAMAAVALTMDPTLFNNRFYTHDPHYGLALNGLGLVLALAKLTTLARGCGVPLSRASLVSLGATLSVIYLGGAPFNFAAFQGSAAYFALLCWSPLVIAFLSPGPEYFDLDSADLVEQASVRTTEFRFAALLLPFLGLALHLWQMPKIYDLPTSLGLLASWLLAFVVLTARHFPEDIHDWLPIYGFMAAASFALVLGDVDLLQLHTQGGAVTSLRLLLLAHALVGAYLALRSRLRCLEIYTLTMAGLFLAGGTPEEIALTFVGPYGWTLLSMAGLLAYRKDQGFYSAVAAWISVSGLIANLWTGSVISLEALHLAGVGFLVLSHAFEGAAEEQAAAATMMVLALLGHAGQLVLSMGSMEAWILLGVEGTLLLVGAIWTPFLRYRVPATLGGIWMILETPLIPWFLDHQAGVGLGGAFVLLGGGCWVSLHKGELLTQLESLEEVEALDEVEVEG
jgi:hypothetical protein